MVDNKEYEVKFEYFSSYENEDENISTNIVETFNVKSLDELFGMLGMSDNEELFDMDFDDSEGINFDAVSEMIESGRSVVWIKDNKKKIIWPEN